MAHASVIPGKTLPPHPPGVGASLRRLLGRKEEGLAAQQPASFWTSGVTYRGYLGVDRDVQNLWISEEQMRETQALLRVAAAAGRLGAWAVDLREMRWTWSDEVKAIHDLDVDVVPSTEQVLAFYSQSSQERALDAFEACAGEGTPFDLELELTTAKGRHVWIRAIGEPERDAEGRVTHLRGAIQDVTRTRAATDEVRRTAERFTRTLEGLTDGFVLLDPAWRFVYLNPEAERILRRPRSELLGRSLLTEFPETAAGRFLKTCEEAIRDGRTLEFEKFFPPLAIWIYMKVSPTDQGLTLCIRDDTERINARREVLRLKAQLDARNA